MLKKSDAPEPVSKKTLTKEEDLELQVEALEVILKIKNEELLAVASHARKEMLDQLNTSIYEWSHTDLEPEDILEKIINQISALAKGTL